jgi:hypothetical protein
MEQFHTTEGPWNRLTPRSSSTNLANQHTSPEHNEPAGLLSDGDSSNNSSRNEEADDDGDDEDVDNDESGLPGDSRRRRRRRTSRRPN